MSGNRRFIPLEQFSHLFLWQPDSIAIKSCLNFCNSVVSCVNNQFCIRVHDISPSGTIPCPVTLFVISIFLSAYSLHYLVTILSLIRHFRQFNRIFLYVKISKKVRPISETAPFPLKHFVISFKTVLKTLSLFYLCFFRILVCNGAMTSLSVP